MSAPSRRANPNQPLSADRTFFVTSCTFGRAALLQTDRSAQLFIRVLYEYRVAGKYKLHEFVVMNNHVHLLLSVGGEMTIERAVQFVKGGFAHRAHEKFGLRRRLTWPQRLKPAKLLA